MSWLSRAFYARDPVLVARALLGQRLVRLAGGSRLSGAISETEAYEGPDDQASHAYRRTARSDIMYRLPGLAYVYLIYGRNFCLNAVAHAPEQAAGAVLIRAILPQEGMDVMQARRGSVALQQLTNGPGKVCQALGIGRAENGLDLTVDGELFIEAVAAVDDSEVIATPRVGVRGNAQALERPWRFLWRGDGRPGARRLSGALPGDG